MAPPDLEKPQFFGMLVRAIMAKPEDKVLEDDSLSKAAVLRRALVVAFSVFFFAVTFFIVIVIVLAKLASKIGGGSQ